VKLDIDSTLACGFCTFAMLFLWFFLRSSLERNPGKAIVGTLTTILALAGLVGWLRSPSRLEFIMLLFPIAQFYAYRRMLTEFQRKYHRTPIVPSLGNAEGAPPPDLAFNSRFLLISSLIPFICDGFIVMKLHNTI
jgi:hypothetical protein